MSDPGDRDSPTRYSPPPTHVAYQAPCFILDPKNNNPSTKSKPTKKDRKQDNRIAALEKRVTRKRTPRKRTVVQPSSTLTGGRLNSMHPIFTACGMDYFRALVNPFGRFDEFPCIPTSARGSQKLRIFKRGTFQVGTSGLGAVVVWPQNLVFGGPSTQPGPLPTIGNCIITTTAAYAAPDFFFMNASSHPSGQPFAGTADAYGNSIYSADDLSGANVARGVRLVGAGLRVRYNGPAFQMNGDIITWRNPTNSSVVGNNNDNWDSLQQLQTATYEPVQPTWATATYAPYVDSDTAWLPNYGNSAASMTSRLGMGIFVNANVGDRYSYEVVAFFEVTGDRIPETISHASPVETQKAISAVNAAIIPSGGLLDQARTAVDNIYKDTVLPRSQAALGKRTLLASVMQGSTGETFSSSVFANPYLQTATTMNAPH